MSESYPSISRREKVKFDNVKLNIGNRRVSILHIDLHLAKLIVSKVAAVGNCGGSKSGADDMPLRSNLDSVLISCSFRGKSDRK